MYAPAHTITDRPYDFSNVDQLLIQFQMPIQFSFNKPITNLARDFIERCLQANELTRMSIQELFKHPLLKPDFDDLLDEVMSKSMKMTESVIYSRSKSTILQLRETVQKNNIDIDEIFNHFDKDSITALPAPPKLVLAPPVHAGALVRRTCVRARARLTGLEAPVR